MHGQKIVASDSGLFDGGEIWRETIGQDLSLSWLKPWPMGPAQMLKPRPLCSQGFKGTNALLQQGKTWTVFQSAARLDAHLGKRRHMIRTNVFSSGSLHPETLR